MKDNPTVKVELVRIPIAVQLQNKTKTFIVQNVPMHLFYISYHKGISADRIIEKDMVKSPLNSVVPMALLAPKHNTQLIEELK